MVNKTDMPYGIGINREKEEVDIYWL